MKTGTQTKPALSCKAAVQLAAPHTWPAAVLPVLLGAALSCALGFGLRPWLLLCTLAVGVLLQSAVNTLNDWADFVSGLDSPENCTDATDAALIYECSSPRAALALGLALALGAAVCGGVLTALRGPVMLVYGGLGLAGILLYVLPGVSFSALPLGELLSGGVMGGVLTCASFHAQAGRFDPRLCWLCLPAVLTVGCIMLVNNTADIEKDRAGGRRTLPVCLGRPGAQRLLRSALVLAALGVGLILTAGFPAGAAALPVTASALVLDPQVRGLFTAPVTPERRGPAMKGVLSAHTWLCGGYAAGLALACLAG